MELRDETEARNKIRKRIQSLYYLVCFQDEIDLICCLRSKLVINYIDNSISITKDCMLDGKGSISGKRKRLFSTPQR
jgi:hypothetical protein